MKEQGRSYSTLSDRKTVYKGPAPDLYAERRTPNSARRLRRVLLFPAWGRMKGRTTSRPRKAGILNREEKEKHSIGCTH